MTDIPFITTAICLPVPALIKKFRVDTFSTPLPCLRLFIPPEDIISRVSKETTPSISLSLKTLTDTRENILSQSCITKFPEDVTTERPSPSFSWEVIFSTLKSLTKKTGILRFSYHWGKTSIQSTPNFSTNSRFISSNSTCRKRFSRINVVKNSAICSVGIFLTLNKRNNSRVFPCKRVAAS